MNHFKISSALLFGAAFALPGISHAQPVLDKTPIVDAANVKENTTEVEKTIPVGDKATIKVRNMPSALLAYWLDPTRQKMPTQLQISQGNGNFQMRGDDFLPRQPGNGYGPRDLKLPPGVEILASIDPQNIVLVKGSAAGIEALRKLVAEIDVPLNQVEIEAQFCQMSPQVFKELPLNFVSGKSKTRAASVAVAPRNIAAALVTLITANKVRVITAPRITAIDGLTARLVSPEIIPLILLPQNTKPANVAADNKQWESELSLVTVETGLTCRPTLHGDLIHLSTQLALNGHTVNFSGGIGDGESLAIAMPVEEAKTRTVVFLTARVVRRAGDRTARATQAGAPKLGLLGNPPNLPRLRP